MRRFSPSGESGRPDGLTYVKPSGPGGTGGGLRAGTGLSKSAVLARHARASSLQLPRLAAWAPLQARRTAQARRPKPLSRSSPCGEATGVGRPCCAPRPMLAPAHQPRSPARPAPGRAAGRLEEGDALGPLLRIKLPRERAGPIVIPVGRTPPRVALADPKGRACAGDSGLLQEWRPGADGTAREGPRPTAKETTVGIRRV